MHEAAILVKMLPLSSPGADLPLPSCKTAALNPLTHPFYVCTFTLSFQLHACTATFPPSPLTHNQMDVHSPSPPSFPINGNPLAPYNAFCIPAVLLPIKNSLGRSPLLHVKKRTETITMAAPFLFPSSLLLLYIKTGSPRCCKFGFAAASLILKPEYVEGEKLLPPSFSVQSTWAATMVRMPSLFPLCFFSPCPSHPPLDLLHTSQIISEENRCCPVDRRTSRHCHRR